MKGSKSCPILYKNTELEIGDNHKILGINFKGKKITDKYGFNKLVLTLKLRMGSYTTPRRQDVYFCRIFEGSAG